LSSIKYWHCGRGPQKEETTKKCQTMYLSCGVEMKNVLILVYVAKIKTKSSQMKRVKIL